MAGLYSKTKLFHYKEKLDSLPRSVDAILPPVHIRIKPTNVCNHNCRYCAYRVDNLQLGQNMNIRDFIPRDKMMEIVDDIIEMKVQAVTFSGGGDPFCYPYLEETVEKLAASPVKFAALTNGARLTGRIAERFARHATWLRISMDGWDDASYRHYRGVGDGEYTRILNNMAAFMALRPACYLGVSMIIDRDNASHIFEMVSRLKAVGVNSVKLSPCIVDNEGGRNNAYHQPIFEQVKEQIQKTRSELADPSFEIYDAYHELDDKFQKTYEWCPYLQVLMVIGADQNVYSCQDKAYNLQDGLLGSIRNQRFRDFWMTGKEKFFKIDPSRVCGHHCVANGKNLMVLEYLNADPDHLGFV